MEAALFLEDGKYYTGKLLGQEGTTWGEIVFNTSMTGFEEILTDPSYRGQIVLLTYPLIGNYGFNEKDIESYNLHLEGLVIKNTCDNPHHWQSNNNLNSYLVKNNKTGITDIDTRSLTKHIRENGNMFGIISSEFKKIENLKEKLFTGVKEKRNLVKEVSVSEPVLVSGDGPRIVVMDFGVKYNILRYLKNAGAELIIVPANTSKEEVMNYSPDGILLSSGPGDPGDLSEIIKEIKKIIGKIPTFGICLGHQLLGLALGGSTYKMKFGHHGGNHPVKDLNTGKVIITTQNHGYALKDNLPSGIEVTHRNLNDQTIEGMRYTDYAIFSLQYHPEAAPGPADSNYIFHEFISSIEGNKKEGSRVKVV